ncbi:MAG: hypothetical protein LBR83_09675, partial [Clostridiales bacterium]|nr:hypothetical protein [Clostridiales bacterium]
MTIIDQIRAELYPMPLGEKNRQGTLRYILFLTGPQEYKAAKGLNKDELVEALCRYFCAPKRFEQLWGRLSAPEQKILSLHVWSNGTEPVESAREIAKEFGIQGRQRSFFYLYERNGLDVYKAYYADQNSLLWLLVPRGVIFPAFRKELYGIVGEMKRRYSDIANRYVFFSRENRKGDFQNIVRFCNGKKLSVTKSGALSKASAIKIWEACGYEEFTAEVNAEPKEMRTTDGLWVTYPLTTLCMLGGLLGVAEEKVVVGGNALTLSSLSHEQLVKKLLEAYLKSKNYNEVSILRGINAKRGHNPADARQNIAGELRYCPVGQPVLISEFERYLRITNLFFARKDGRYVVNTGGGDYYYGAVWEQYEQPLIRIILSFFFALGLIDVTWGKIVSEDGEAGRIVPAAFTLNPLGAFAFGFTHSY